MAFDATFDGNWLNETVPAREVGRCMGEVSAGFEVNHLHALRIKGIHDSELAAFDKSIRRAQREGTTSAVTALISLRDRMLAAKPTSYNRGAQMDTGAMLEVRGCADHLGSRVRIGPGILSAVVVAIQALLSPKIAYHCANDDAVQTSRSNPTACAWGPRST